MVDVGDKQDTQRVAVTEGRIVMLPETLALIQRGDHKKGDVLGIARVAGIMAAKKTAELIPLCHPLALTTSALISPLNLIAPPSTAWPQSKPADRQASKWSRCVLPRWPY